MPIHVSIHDVSPIWSEEIAAALDLCHALFIRPALLVVPNFHGDAPLLESPSFCERLRVLQRDGHEVYLHGLLHQSGAEYDPRTGGSRAAWLFAQRVVSGGEAEMTDVSEDEGQTRIEQGERVLGQAGLRIDGFVAPAWSTPKWLLPLLARRNYRYTEDHFRVYDPMARRSRASLVLNWATRSPWRVLSTMAWCRAARPARAMVPMRIAIHPGDMRYRAVRAEVRAALAWAERDTVPRGRDLLSTPSLLHLRSLRPEALNRPLPTSEESAGNERPLTTFEQNVGKEPGEQGPPSHGER